MTHGRAGQTIAGLRKDMPRMTHGRAGQTIAGLRKDDPQKSRTDYCWAERGSPTEEQDRLLLG